MEFKYRAIDQKPTPTPTPTLTPTPPLSTVSYVNPRSLPGGFPIPNHGSEALRRELEKEKIRREIIAGEYRRRELEEEVRAELALERVLGISMHRSLVTSQGMSLIKDSMELPLWVKPTLSPIDDGVFGVPQPEPQQITTLPEIVSSSQSNKDRVIILDKPDSIVCGAKRKAVTPAVSGSEDLKKKPKEEWSCSLCRIRTTSEKGLQDHLQGKKHKAKEAAMTHKIGLEESVEMPSQSLQPSMTRGGMNLVTINKGVTESKNEEFHVPINKNIICSEDKNGTATEKLAQEISTLTKKRNFNFFCELCQVGTHSLAVMEDHKKGRKHLKQMKNHSENNRISVSSSSVSLETEQKKIPILKAGLVFPDIEEVSKGDMAGERAKETCAAKTETEQQKILMLKPRQIFPDIEEVLQGNAGERVHALNGDTCAAKKETEQKKIPMLKPGLIFPDIVQVLEADTVEGSVPGLNGDTCATKQETEQKKIPMLKPGLIFPDIVQVSEADTVEGRVPGLNGDTCAAKQESEQKKIPMLKPGLNFPDIVPVSEADTVEGRVPGLIGDTHATKQETEQKKIPMLKPGLIFPNIVPVSEADTTMERV